MKTVPVLQLAIGVLGFYGIIILWATSGKKKEAEVPAILSTSASTGKDEIPSVDAADFGDWLGGEGNLEKLISSL